MKREVRGASPAKTGEDEEQETCTDKKWDKCVAASHFHSHCLIVSPMIICTAKRARERRPSKAWGESKNGKGEDSNVAALSNSVKF